MCTTELAGILIQPDRRGLGCWGERGDDEGYRNEYDEVAGVKIQISGKVGNLEQDTEGCTEGRRG
jgi:hypothetical protein